MTPFTIACDFENSNNNLPSLEDQQARIVEFDPGWFSKKDVLPIHVGDWILRNLSVGETVMGVRFIPGFFLQFKLQRPRDKGDGFFYADFTLASGHRLRAFPGQIWLHEKKTNRKLRVWCEYVKPSRNGVEWKLSMLEKIVYPDNFSTCPSRMIFALRQINQMMLRMIPSYDEPARPYFTISTCSRGYQHISVFEQGISKFAECSSSVHTNRASFAVHKEIYEYYEEFVKDGCPRLNAEDAAIQRDEILEAARKIITAEVKSG